MAKAKKVLVGEDSSVIQNLTKKILQFQNYEITGAKDGQQVLKYLDKENYDILLLDINMPKMDGMECAVKVREQNNDIPMIAITGNAKNYSIDDFKNVGINDYLPKPLDYDAMVEMVKKYVE